MKVLLQTPEATPLLQLDTLLVLDGRRRIISTREPFPSPGPAFMLIRGATAVAWAVRADVAEDVAGELEALARQETVSTEWERPPLHAGRYQEVLGGAVHFGPAFEFANVPEFVRSTDAVPDVVSIHDEARLQRHFSGWVAGEIEVGAAPMMGVLSDGEPVSVCFCSRRSAVRGWRRRRRCRTRKARSKPHPPTAASTTG